MQLARKPMAPRPRPKPGGPKGPKCARVLPANRLSRRDFDRLVLKLRRRRDPIYDAKAWIVGYRRRSLAEATAKAVGMIKFRPARRRAA